MKLTIKHTSIAILFTYLLAQLLPVLLAQIAPKQLKIEFVVYGTLLFFALGTLIMIQLNRKSTIRNSITLQKSLSLKQVITWGIIGVFAAIIMQKLAQFIEVHLFQQTIASQNSAEIFAIINKYPLFLLTTVLFGPIMEEFVFRKVIFGFFFDLTGAVGAAVISSLLFAFVHMDGHFLVYSTMGLVFCFLYTKTKNIATPIIAHVLMNTIAVILSLI
ncbi:MULTISPECIES: CPBP family intramembrane glutamic endopeptidase [Carnobacterium]|uniref:CPBP family intramembrane glutamic endopeptidase n=1 Tax=Carnobacterium TaxID=2747 RepID=UPI00026C83B5|nr:type II CAAX endopeptidase family protein [Carnobacterium maltaromaticum]KRN72003.1 membrane protease [Carnobacterium maltaromaticum]MBC9787831.1 CPBP family intramembrane metalloprotease [Carnobacterium maltaromaticum]TFJ71988.1 CPBP family intramembrane metalloprotease [Carnobacterium maltaromaticum]TFJ76901.1 CPBP family intramembrane metalloprotease [Carnobacterium maltaromaticum]CRH19696.1 CAAX amino terminal protease family protein [Carnobacterium maltaromaticum]